VPKGGIAPFGNPTGFAQNGTHTRIRCGQHFSQIRKTKVGVIRPSIGRIAPFCFVLRPRRCRSKSDYNFSNRNRISQFAHLEMLKLRVDY
jgi:hypothetical protein